MSVAAGNVIPAPRLVVAELIGGAAYPNTEEHAVVSAEDPAVSLESTQCARIPAMVFSFADSGVPVTVTPPEVCENDVTALPVVGDTRFATVENAFAIPVYPIGVT